MDAYQIFLLADTPTNQKKKLLSLITETQALNISEVVVNLLHRVLKVSPSYQKKLKEDKDLWFKLAKTTNKQRVKLIRRNSQKILTLLKAVEISLRQLWNIKK